MERVRELVAGATGIPLGEVDDSIGFGLHPLWDSVAQISIVMSIEEAFGITVPDESIASLTSISGIAEFVSKHDVS